MTRYYRLFSKFVSFSLSRAFHFRVDFFFRIFLDAVTYIVNILFFKLIYMHSQVLAGWTESQVMIFVAGYLVVDGLRMALFSNNTFALPKMVNDGSLDYYLTRPCSPFFMLSFRDFAANSFVSLSFAVGILAWMLVQYPVPLDPGSIALFVLLLLNGVILSHLLHMTLILPVFWIQGGRGLEGLFWAFSQFMGRPDALFHGLTRGLLVTILPFSVMASLPAQVLFSDNVWPLVFHCLGVTLLYAALFFVAWKKALNSYSSASS